MHSHALDLTGSQWSSCETFQTGQHSKHPNLSHGAMMIQQSDRSKTCAIHPNQANNASLSSTAMLCVCCCACQHSHVLVSAMPEPKVLMPASAWRSGDAFFGLLHRAALVVRLPCVPAPTVGQQPQAGKKQGSVLEAKCQAVLFAPASDAMTCTSHGCA